MSFKASSSIYTNQEFIALLIQSENVLNTVRSVFNSYNRFTLLIHSTTDTFKVERKKKTPNKLETLFMLCKGRRRAHHKQPLILHLSVNLVQVKTQTATKI